MEEPRWLRSYARLVSAATALPLSVVEAERVQHMSGFGNQVIAENIRGGETVDEGGKEDVSCWIGGNLKRCGE